MDAEAARYMAAGLCMGIGSIAPALAEGFVAGKAMESIGRNPEVSDKITPTMITAMAICESTGIYALIISLLILFVA
ncbi:ATP synthase F0 subunit C [bacterium]|jgi:F-type H+-transporting ATPase subunit c|nr:ATP synthase F0 subunit C [bacterium]